MQLRHAAHVILVFLRVMTLIETIGIAAVRQALQFAEQVLVEWTPCDRIVDRAAIHLRGARHVIARLGTALDLQ